MPLFLLDGEMEDYFDQNRSIWNGLAEINFKTAFYDVNGFKSGKLSLNKIELEELGDVSKRSLLHLQCHFGLDTLSWAKLGAEVTGVDLSNKAIELAKELCRETGLSANFLCSNIYDLPKLLNKKFDILFTSYGAITWLPDLEKWAEIISHFLKPGGVFYIIEFHPVLFMLDEQGKELKYSYFHQTEPLEVDNENSYADQTTTFKHKSYEWNHSLSDVINALIKVGLGLEYVHEFPYSAYNCWPFLEELEEGKWVVKGYSTKLPMMFSIKAIKRE